MAIVAALGLVAIAATMVQQHSLSLTTTFVNRRALADFGYQPAWYQENQLEIEFLKKKSKRSSASLVEDGKSAPPLFIPLSSATGWSICLRKSLIS